MDEKDFDLAEEVFQTTALICSIKKNMADMAKVLANAERILDILQEREEV